MTVESASYHSAETRHVHQDAPRLDRKVVRQGSVQSSKKCTYARLDAHVITISKLVSWAESNVVEAGCIVLCWRSELRYGICPSFTPQLQNVVQDWPGEQKFYNDGQFFLQKTYLGAFRTILLILVLEGLFLGLVARRLNTPWNIIAMSTSYVLVARFVVPVAVAAATFRWVDT
jgi:hypothetical protein